jgi:hypothetical protein
MLTAGPLAGSVEAVACLTRLYRLVLSGKLCGRVLGLLMFFLVFEARSCAGR